MYYTQYKNNKHEKWKRSDGILRQTPKALQVEIKVRTSTFNRTGTHLSSWSLQQDTEIKADK